MNENGLDFGELVKVTSTGGVVTLHIDRKVMLTGDAIKGRSPEEFAIEDPDGVGQELSFVLDPQATLRSTEGLNNNPDQNTPHTLTEAQFVRNAHRLEADGLITKVWLRHRDGRDGPVTALAEQYIP